MGAILIYQRTSGHVNAHLTSGPVTCRSIITSFDLVVKLDKVNLGSSFKQALTGPMIHSKPQCHWPFGFREDFIFFTKHGSGSQLGHVTYIPQSKFRSLDLLTYHMQFGFDWPTGFEKMMFKINGHIHVHVYSPGQPPGVDCFI